MFKDRLRSSRIARGLTMQQIADTLNIGLRHYQKYESGHATPTLDRLVNIADVLNVPTDFLLGRDDYLGVSVDVPLENPPKRPAPRINR